VYLAQPSQLMRKLSPGAWPLLHRTINNHNRGRIQHAETALKTCRLPTTWITVVQAGASRWATHCARTTQSTVALCMPIYKVQPHSLACVGGSR
jgi:hypothetical protein